MSSRNVVFSTYETFLTGILEQVAQVHRSLIDFEIQSPTMIKVRKIETERKVLDNIFFKHTEVDINN